MDPQRDRFTAVVEGADQIEGPQRPLAVEVLGHQQADDLPKVFPRSTFRRRSPDVRPDVEIRCGDPAWLRSGYVDTLHRARLA
jgi:hypothetical protein